MEKILETYGGILPVLLIVLVTVISAISKKKRQIAPGEMEADTQSRRYTDDVDDPWHSLGEWEEEGEYGEDTRQWHTVSTFNPAPESGAERPGERVGMLKNHEAVNIEQAAERRREYAETTGKKKSERPTSGEEKPSTEEVAPHNIIEGFNLIDAVIYSELLKPKFEEE